MSEYPLSDDTSNVDIKSSKLKKKSYKKGLKVEEQNDLSCTSGEKGDMFHFGSNIQVKEKERQLNEERQNLIDKFLQTVGRLEKRLPLKIVLIGTPAAGKSSFINSIAAALSDDHWREYAYTVSGEQRTLRLESYEGDMYCQSERCKGYALPTLIDVAGFQDENTVLILEILKIIFYGNMNRGHSLNDAFTYAKRHGIPALSEKYKIHQHLAVDRIIFVASATEPVPTKLIECMKMAARPVNGSNKREIPIFGVMTKTDKKHSPGGSSSAYVDKKNSLLQRLSLIGASHRFAECVNYCDDVCTAKERLNGYRPAIDIPILDFMTVICGANYRRRGDDQYFEEDDIQMFWSFVGRCGPILMLLGILVVFILFLCFGSILMPIVIIVFFALAYCLNTQNVRNE